MLVTIIIFIIILGILVFVHELGHFLAAKRSNVKVEEFGFGFPPRIFGFKRGETIYSINAIPLGGFVKILGEDGQERNNPRSFGAKKIWQRALILVAGVSMNVLLAVFLLSLGNIIGLPTPVDDSQDNLKAKVQILEIAPNSPAELAGLKTGDVIIKLESLGGESKTIDKVIQVQDFSETYKGEEILLTYKRGQQVLSAKIIPRVTPPQGEGAMGIVLTRIADISLSWYRAIYEGFVTTFGFIWLILKALGFLLWQLVSQGRFTGDVAGPVGIYNLTSQAQQFGFIYLLQLTVLLSINLAIINIFPFPALDGGRLIFLLVEKIKGSPVSQKIEKAIHSAGFAFLILVMILVTVRDVMKLF